MARSDVTTQLSLDDFAKIVGIHPLHFNQVVAVGAESRTCGIPILQHSWQDADRVGREEISDAIYAAEQEIMGWLHYDISETWISEEHHYGGNSRINFNWSTSELHTEHLNVISGGARAKVLVVAGVAIGYTDADSDGYFETATITFATTLTNPDELEIYYPNKSGDDGWRIQCTRKSISGGVATLVTRRERLVKEALMETLEVLTVEGADNASFLTSVDVYRVYNDPTHQVDFMVNGCDCGGTCQACTYSVQSGCISILNPESGFVRVTPANWDPVNLVYNSALCVTGYCDRVRLWYKAGKRNHNIDQAISWLALTYLDRPICSCNNLEHITKWWATDFALRISGRDRAESYNLSGGGRRQGQLDNPFGTTRAALTAWRIVNNARKLYH